MPQIASEYAGIARCAAVLLALLALAGATACAASSAETTLVRPADAVRPIGRADLTPDGGYAFAWSGSGFELEFDGGRLEAVIDNGGENWVNVDVDGRVRALELAPGIASYSLVDAEPATRRVRVTRRTEALVGATTLIELQADGAVRPTSPPSRRILVIGDSISTGYGVEGADETCMFSPATQNHDAAYAALAARALGADVRTVAISGRGLMRNFSDASEPTMTESRRLEYPGGPEWSGVAYDPQAIVVHLGTNDFAGHDPGEAFVAAYATLLDELAREHPNARLYAAFGPMLDDPGHARAEAAIGAAIARTHAPVTFVAFEWGREGRRYGCDWHPGRDTQVAMADVLRARLETDLGWTAQR